MSASRAVVTTPLGPLTVVAADEAIVALTWGSAEPTARTPIVREAEDQLVAYFAKRRRHFDLPLRLCGTPFHVAVWQLLRDIPYGETLTYGALAARAGSSPRAVGAACGRNPIPVVVPCHRVIGAGNKLTGYSGGNGTVTKAALLALERNFAGAASNPSCQ